MKFIKQISLLLILVFLIGIIPVYADAQLAVTLSTSNTSVKAGSIVSLNVNITSQNEIDKAEIYVNDTFFATLHNPESSFTYNYVTSKDANGTLNFKLVAYDALGQSATSNIVSAAVSANSETAITFKDVPETVKIDELSSIKAQIIDSDGIAKAELYINNKLSEAQYDVDGDIYTFTGFTKNLGDMNFEIKVTDNAGAVTTAHKKVIVENRYISPLFAKNPMNSVPGGNFKTNAANGYSFSAAGTDDKYMKITRASVPAYKSTYFRYQVRDGHGDLEGVFEVEFELKISSDAYNNFSINFDPRGTGAEPITPTISNGGKIELKNGTNAANTKTISNYLEAEKWYRLKYTCDTINKTYRFFVEDIELTSDGTYKLPLADNVSIGPMIYIAITVLLPEQNDAVGIDDVSFSYEKKQADIDEAVYSDGVFTAVVKDGLSQDGLNNNISILNNEKTIPLSSVDYNSTSKLLTVIPKTPLDFSNRYSLVIKSGTENAEAKPLELDSYTYFSTPADVLDVKDVVFDEYKDGKGVKAMVSNNTSDSQTVVMLMTVKNANGAVERVYSSDEITLTPVQNNVLISISPVPVSDGNVEVFFLNGWAQSRAIKKYVFTK
ncbi:MAG: hypothetical protein IKJ68_00240 [Clostridia bacterium]|nr:hypothetical protein [Clostridia bacterium]